MVDTLFRMKKSEKADIEETKPWEKPVGWTNPFEDEEEILRRERKEERRRRKQKKKRSHRHRMTEEEYDEMSSKADSMLDEILSENLDNHGCNMPQVREDYGTEDGDSTRAVQQGSNPFDDLEEASEVVDGEEINKEEYAALMLGLDSKSSKVDFKKAVTYKVDSSKKIGNNPFEVDSVVDSGLGKVPKIKEDLTRKHTDTTEEEQAESLCSSLEPPPVEEDDEDEEEEGEEEEEEEEEEGEEEDIVESSKRLLRMADERIQYQQHCDEVKSLTETINMMKQQAEAMSEQLRRAIETKCDLVLAQTEMERCHEQNMIAKDDEIRDMKLYTIQLLETQSKDELNFMNEISTLSNRLQEMVDKHKTELAQKDAIISKLELQLKAVQIDLTVEPSVQPRHSFRSRFFETGRSPITAIRV